MKSVIGTFPSQGSWDLAAPRSNRLDLRDVAWALSRICRFNGHVAEHYSVAQHSVLVASMLPPELQRAGLFHDAQEAALGDMSSPQKYTLRQAGDHARDDLESEWEEHIRATFAVIWSPAIAFCVKQADLMALAIEKRDVIGQSTPAWSCWDLPDPSAYPRLSVMSQRGAYEAFLTWELATL